VASDDILKRVHSQELCSPESPNSIFGCTSIFEVDYLSYSFGKSRLNWKLPKSCGGSQFPDFLSTSGRFK
jgi:hypothetical protein